MSILNADDGALYVSAIAGLAHERGVHIRMGDDFYEYRDILGQHRKEQPPSMPFDPDHHKLGPDAGFWFTGVDEAGKLVFTQAMRKLDLGHRSLAEYLSDRYVDFYPAGMPVDLARCRYHAGPGARNIRGEVYYHGDLWTLSGAKSMRGTGLPNVLARLAMVTTLMRSTPDYVFGFIAQRLSFKGLGDREGYMHHDPASLHLCKADTREMIICQLVYMGSEDLRHLLTIPPEGVMAQ